jgi:hypothetical protein
MPARRPGVPRPPDRDRRAAGTGAMCAQGAIASDPGDGGSPWRTERSRPTLNWDLGTGSQRAGGRRTSSVPAARVRSLRFTTQPSPHLIQPRNTRPSPHRPDPAPEAHTQPVAAKHNKAIPNPTNNHTQTTQSPSPACDTGGVSSRQKPMTPPATHAALGAACFFLGCGRGGGGPAQPTPNPTPKHAPAHTNLIQPRSTPQSTPT